MTFEIQNVHSKVQQRLQIKYVDAKQLTSQAISRFEEINNRKLISSSSDDTDTDQVVEYTVILFNQLSLQEQSRMKLINDTTTTKNDNNNNNITEPEWKRKARMAALKRELEWKNISKKEEGTSSPIIAPGEQAIPNGTQLETTKSTTTNEEVVAENGACKTTTLTTKITTSSTVTTNYGSESPDKSVTTASSTPRKSTTSSSNMKEGTKIQRKGKWQKCKKEDLPEGYEENNKDKLRHVTCLCTIM